MEPPNENFQNALVAFKRSLTEKQRQEFKVCSLQDVNDTIKKIETSLAARRQQRNMRRMAKFVEGMRQLGQVVEVFLNVDATVAFVWAPIKFLLLVAGTWVETLDCLLDTYSEIGDVLPTLTKYKTLVPKYPCIRVHLENYYCAVLEFHRKALDVFSRPNWKMAFHSSWTTFKTRFGGTVRELKRYRDLLSDEKITATILEVQELRQSIEEKLNELSRKVDDLHISADESAAFQYREQVDKKRQFVLSKIDPPDYDCDFERASKERQGTGSGNWLLGHATFQEWVDATSPNHRGLYVSGIPGTGKSIFASWIVEHLKKLQASSNKSGLAVSLVYFFFKSSQPDKRTINALFRSIICQLVFQDEVLVDIIYQKCLATGKQRIDSESLLRDLAATALRSQRLCYIVVDGLDECVGDSMPGNKKAQEDVIDWFKSTMGEDDAESPEPPDRSIRLLICAQRNGTLEERLSMYPQIQLEAVDAHLRDLETYAELRSFCIRRKFSRMVDEECRKKVVRRVCSGAKGMFLYAKIVLGNLLNQVSVARFQRELDAENFPKGLEEAYERVIICVLENSVEEERETARRILGLVVTAERPLMWKEIQSHFCIEIDDEVADPDLRVQDTCKYFCGSLIEVEHNNNKSASPADAIIHLVHETARGYLLHTGRFHLEIENAKLALFYARYLTSNAFLTANEESDIKKHFVTGYCGLLDYAAANWWKHASQVIRSGSPNEEDTLILLRHAQKLQASNAVQDTPQDTERVPMALELESLRNKMTQLSSDGRDWEAVFPIENRLQRIRASLESLFADQEVVKLEAVQELYGSLSYKCPKPWCHFFLNGFEAFEKREKHLSEHERPFRCDADGCYGSQVGFSTEPDLAKHKDRVHAQNTELDFPSLAIELAKSNSMDIFKAAAKGDFALVQELVASGCDVNSHSLGGEIPLHLAAARGHLEVCRYLLDRGAKVDAQSGRRKETALHIAAKNGDADLAHLLISKYGASTNLRNRIGKTAIGIACKKWRKEVIAAFPAKSWAHQACKGVYCETAAVKIPMEITSRSRGEIETINSIHQAISRESTDIAKSLVRNGCFDLNYEKGPKGNTVQLLPLHQAILYNQTDVVKELLRSGRLQINKGSQAAGGLLPLHYACKYSSSKPIIEELLSETSSIDTPDSEGNNIMHLLLKNRRLQETKDYRDHVTSLISAILASGKLDINTPNAVGQLPLHVACHSRNLAAVTLLLPQTSKIDVMDRTEQTPFHIAAANEFWEIGRALVKARPVNLFTSKHGLSILNTSILRSQVYIMDLLFWKESSINFSNTGITSLHWGAWSLNPRVIKREIAMGDKDANSSAVELPWAWDQALTYKTATIDNPPTKSLLSTALFLAMNLMHDGDRTTILIQEETLKTILEAPGLDISEHLKALPEEYQVIPIRLVCGLRDQTLWGMLVKVGFSLPLKLLVWNDSFDGPLYIYMKVQPIPDISPSTGTVAIPVDLVLTVIHGSQCNFLDIVKSNFTLAKEIVYYLKSQSRKDIKVNFGGAEDGISLLMELQKHEEGLSALTAMIYVGFDGYNTLLNAAFIGRIELVQLLLATGMLSVLGQWQVTDATGATAYDIAVREGHQKVAELLASKGFYSSGGLADHGFDGPGTEIAMEMEENGTTEQPLDAPEGYWDLDYWQSTD